MPTSSALAITVSATRTVLLLCHLDLRTDRPSHAITCISTMEANVDETDVK